MNTPRQELLDALSLLSANYPDLRLGQLMMTVSNWATRRPDGLWDVTDEELLAAIAAHLERAGVLQTTT